MQTCSIRLTPEEAAIVADQFHDAGRTITLHGPFIDLSAGSPDAAIRKVHGEAVSTAGRPGPDF